MERDIISIKVNNLKSKSSLKIRENIDKVSKLKSNVLLVGETGVGKDIWAEYLYVKSGVERFLNLNCGDVPENLIYSEWFGYKKGAFTGADKDNDGKWLNANGGILFLNGIDLLSLNLQSKLLRIIERKKFFPLGSTVEKDINVRFLFSVDNDILKKVNTGLFRADLFYRISTFTVEIPPLRERKSDIISLFDYFTKKNKIIVSLSEEGTKILKDYNWNGNIRELENFVNRVTVLKNKIEDEDVFSLIENSNYFFEMEKNDEKSLEELEYDYINYLIKKYKNKSRVAKILKISRKSLYNKINRYEND